MKLNPFENNRSFYSRSKGTTKTVRDTYTKQTNPKIEEVKKVNKPKVKKEEPKIEIKMSGEPLLDEITTKPISSNQPKKRSNTKIEKNEKS